VVMMLVGDMVMAFPRADWDPVVAFHMP